MHTHAGFVSVYAYRGSTTSASDLKLKTKLLSFKIKKKKKKKKKQMNKKRETELYRYPLRPCRSTSLTSSSSSFHFMERTDFRSRAFDVVAYQFVDKLISTAYR